jgi:hypothetical protein
VGADPFSAEGIKMMFWDERFPQILPIFKASALPGEKKCHHLSHFRSFATFVNSALLSVGSLNGI